MTNNDKQNDRPKLKWQKMTNKMTDKIEMTKKMTDKTDMTKNDTQNDKQTEMTKKWQQKWPKNDKLNILSFSTFACLSFF